MLKDTLAKGIAQLPDVRNKDGSRVDGAPEKQPRAARCSVATGSLPVSSAEALLRKWETDIRLFRTLYNTVANHPEEMVNRANWLGRISALETAHEELRRQMEATNERQPEENTPSETRRGQRTD